MTHSKLKALIASLNPSSPTVVQFMTAPRSSCWSEKGESKVKVMVHSCLKWQILTADSAVSSSCNIWKEIHRNNINVRMKIPHELGKIYAIYCF